MFAPRLAQQGYGAITTEIREATTFYFAEGVLAPASTWIVGARARRG